MKKVGIFALFATSTVATSCMLWNEDSSRVCGKDVIIAFSGLTSVAHQQIEIAASASADGTYTVFAIAESSDSPSLQINGVNYYDWRVAGTVPNWSPSSRGYSAFVHASAGGTLLSTFRTGSNYVGCVVTQISHGKSRTEAIAMCQQSTDPVVELTAPMTPAPVAFEGNVTISSMFDAAKYGCTSDVNGSVRIDASTSSPSGIGTEAPITLPYLRTVTALRGATGNAWFTYAQPGTLTPARLPQMPLQSVSGNLELIHPSSATGSAVLDLGLSALVQLGGNLSIDYRAHQIRGLLNLASIPLDFNITARTDVLSANLLLPLLTRVPGNLSLAYGFELHNFLGNITSVGGDVVVARPFGAAQHVGTLDALAHLEIVEGSLTVSDASFDQTSVAFPALRAVGGAVGILSSRFHHLNLGADPIGVSPSLTVGSVRIVDNAQLVSVVAGRIRVASTGPIEFTNNTCLPSAEVSSFAAAQAALGWTGSLTNTGNGTSSGCSP